MSSMHAGTFQYRIYVTFCGGFDERIERHVSVTGDPKRKRKKKSIGTETACQLSRLYITFMEDSRFTAILWSAAGFGDLWSGPKMLIAASLVKTWDFFFLKQGVIVCFGCASTQLVWSFEISSLFSRKKLRTYIVIGGLMQCSDGPLWTREPEHQIHSGPSLALGANCFKHSFPILNHSMSHY